MKNTQTIKNDEQIEKDEKKNGETLNETKNPKWQDNENEKPKPRIDNEKTSDFPW